MLLYSAPKAFISMNSNDELEIAAHFAERFNSPAERASATHALAKMRKSALPILEAIFSGAAKNPYGVAYRDQGMPLLCSYVIAGKLGVLAQSLEPYVHAGVRAHCSYAVEALACMGPLSALSISVLTECAAERGLVAWEAADLLRSAGVARKPEDRQHMS